jgi:hypothetical protein
MAHDSYQTDQVCELEVSGGKNLSQLGSYTPWKARRLDLPKSGAHLET